MSTEEEYKKELAEAGVELDEVAPVVEPEEEAEEEAPEKEVETEEESEEEEDLQEPKEERKRSIYDEYKDKKSELKTEKELREQAEKDRDEWKAKAEAVATAETPEEKKEAQDELEAFATEINADPATMKRMRELFLKDIKPTSGLSDEDRALLKKAQEVEEKQAFETEFKQITPTINEYFPNASQEETDAIKEKLDELAHSKEWHDKSLDYIAFKNKETLSALTSPKKRGIERKNPKDAPTGDTEFNPNADISQMTETEFKVWEEQYRKLGQAEGLETDAQGRKILI